MNFKKWDIIYNFIHYNIKEQHALNAYDYITSELLDQCNLYDIDLVILDSCQFNAEKNNITISTAYDCDDAEVYMLNYIIEHIYDSSMVLHYNGRYRTNTSYISASELSKHKMRGSELILEYFEDTFDIKSTSDVELTQEPIKNIVLPPEPQLTYNSKVINNRKVIIL